MSKTREELEEFQALIDRSSLGAQEVKAIAAETDPKLVERVMERVKELDEAAKAARDPKPVDAFARIEALESRVTELESALREASEATEQIAGAKHELDGRLRDTNRRLDEALDRIAGLRGEVRNGS